MRGIKKLGMLLAAAATAWWLLSYYPMAPSVAKARAGGGQHFSDSGDKKSDSSGDSNSSSSNRSSSSSSSRSSSSRRSSGSGKPADPCAVAVVIVIIILIVVITQWKKKRDAQQGGPAAMPSSGPAPRPAAGVNKAKVAQQVAELKARDPMFSEQAFEDMASTAFFKIQEAWAKRDMNMAKSFISPSLFQRFDTQVAELKRNKQTNRMENLAVGSLDIVEAVHDGGMDYVAVQLNAAAADYTVDDATGNIVSGSKQVSRFTEYWTFLRSDQVKTKQTGPELATKSCPNCGAPIQLNAVGKCDYCGSDVTSGAFSWVLAEISQEDVWKPRSA